VVTSRLLLVLAWWGACGSPGAEGPLTETVIQELFAVCRAERTGVLEVESHGVYTMVYVSKGTPVFAEEGTLGETLGRLLVREGFLTLEQYTSIIEHMTDSVMGAEQMRFGEVAVVLGYLTPEQVNQALARQVRVKIRRCLQAEDAECVFRDDSEELEGIARYPSPVAPLVLRAVRATFDEERVTRILEGAAPACPKLVAPAADVSRRFRMDPAETAFLAELDGTRTTFEILCDSASGGLLALQVLAVLVLAEEVQLLEEPVEGPAATPAPEVRPPAPAEAPASTDHEPTAGADAKPPSGPHVGPPVGVEGRPPAAALARVALRQRLARRLVGGDSKRSHATPSSHPTPAQGGRRTLSRPPSAKAARLRAEKLFQSGKLHVRHERWPLALKDLQEAVRLYPSATEYQLHAEWARFQTLTDPTEMAMLRQELESLAEQALHEDRQMAFAHHVMGQVKLMQGDESGAQRSFRVASKLDPDDKAAARYHRMLLRKLR